MTISNGAPDASKNERRTLAREKARELREAQKKKDRRTRIIFQSSLIVALLAVVAIVFLVIVSAIKPPAPGPLNMISDGIKIRTDLNAVRTAALKPGEDPVPSDANLPASVLDIRIYTDYMCPICTAFEKANAEQIRQLVKDGLATVEIHPIAILDKASKGTKYSTRATNAAACVANFAPDSFFQYNALLFENQPEENTPGLDDEKLIDLTKEAGVVSEFKDISKCINELTFKAWVAATTDRFTTQPLPNVAVQPEPEQLGTPTIYVNGQLYQFTIDRDTHEFDPKEFYAFITKVLGADFAEKSAPEPEPEPTGTSTPSPSPTN